MTRVKKIVFTFLTFVSVYFSVTPVIAGGHCCAKCGCQEDVRCVCRPVWTTKYIQITCWDSVCEDVCLPPPSPCKECYAAGVDAKSSSATGQSGTADACKGTKNRSCNKLVRKTYLQPIPTVVWVVEYVCRHCSGAENTYSIKQDHAENDVYISRISEREKHE